MLRMRTPYYPSFLIAAIMLLLGPCDESLPTYREPASVFSTSIRGDYTLSVIDNSMKVYVTVRNEFDETLQGQASFRGSVEIVSARDPQVRKTFQVSSRSLARAPGYDPATGRLTFNPRDSLVFLFSWNLVDDRGVDLRRDFFRYVRDMSCESRCLAFPEPWILTANLTIFDQRGNTTAQGTYSLCFVSQWINPRDCPPILPTDPCDPQNPPRGQACTPFAGPDN